MIQGKRPSSLRFRFNDARILLALIAGLLAFVVQSGELGTADTMHRLQSTHAFWTAEPHVFPEEYPEFGVHGRGGTLQSWYGIGQSLLMLPADIAATEIARLTVFANYGDTDPSVRDVFVSFTTNILVTMLTALICLRFLQQLGFQKSHAIAGVLALLFATTHLHYTQNMMENNYIFLLTLTGFSCQYEWLQTGRLKPLMLGSAALGLNLLTRLTTGLDLIAAGLFVLLILLMERSAASTPNRQTLSQHCRTYLLVALPVYAVFGLLDRLYQFYRFGSFFNTYVSVVAREARQRDPGLPLSYPFETPFHIGFFGAFFAPEKSIFLFDPLLILLILIAMLGWRRFTAPVRAYLLTTATLLLAYICFYARYTVWSGDFAWGDRYVSTTVELAAMLAIPLLLRYRAAFGKAVWAIGMALLVVSVVIQAASLAFWLPLEIYQMETLGHPTLVIALRFKNIAAFALGKMQAWGLNDEAMTQDPWDFVHITCWNFLPFVLRRVGAAPAWVINTAFAIWGIAMAALATALLRLLAIVFVRAEEPPVCDRSVSITSKKVTAD
jgi:hypothetical protein